MNFDTIGPGSGPVASDAGSAAPVPAQYEVFETPVLDFTVAQSNIELIPARPGYWPRFNNSADFIIDQVSGTQTTPPTTRAGSDSGRVNFIAQAATAPSNANVNAAVAPTATTGPVAAAGTTRALPGLPIFLDIVSGAQGTGGFVLRGRISLAVCWLSVDE